MSQTSTIVDEYVWIHERAPTLESSDLTTREENEDFVIVEEDSDWDVIAADNDPSSASILLPLAPPNSPVLQPTTLSRCPSVRQNLSAANKAINIKPASAIVLGHHIRGLTQESPKDKTYLGELFTRLVGTSETSVATTMYQSPASFGKKLMTTTELKCFEGDVKRLSGLLDQADVRHHFKRQYGGKVFPAEAGKTLTTIAEANEWSIFEE